MTRPDKGAPCGQASSTARAIDAAAFAVTEAGAAVPDSLFASASVVITKLELLGSDGGIICENLYWLAREPAAGLVAHILDAVRALDARLASRG